MARAEEDESMGAFWRDVKAARKEARDRYRQGIPGALERLAQAGIPCRCLDGGQHYRVDERFDWWPSTGYWKALDGSKRGHGVSGLIAAAQRKQEKGP
jgi:hypothetical protein